MSTPHPIEAESIRKFTRAYGLMADPPWLPIAAWIASVPLLSYLGYVGSSVFWLSLLAAAAATAIATRWYRRTYGVVAPSQPKPLVARPVTGIVLLVAMFALEVIASSSNLDVRLGILLFGAYLAWGAVSSGGFRKHLFVLAAICALLAFLPLVIGDSQLQGVVIQTAFGLGWCFVCVADHRVVQRNLALHAADHYGR
jgi:hypothetical protein